MSAVEYVIEKWGGRPHYRGLVRHLGDDDHGSWFWGPAGRTMYRGDVALFITQHDALSVVVPGSWWTPTWWLGHPDVEVYININTPPVREPARIVTTDVDLDVVRYRDGRVEIVDQDEFELHQKLYGYPPEVIEAALTAADTAKQLAEAAEPPFDGAAACAWAERARSGVSRMVDS